MYLERVLGLPSAPSASRGQVRLTVLWIPNPSCCLSQHEIIRFFSFPSSPCSSKMVPWSYTPQYLVSTAVVQPVRFQDSLKLLPLSNRIKERPPVPPCPWKSPQSPVVTLYTLQISSAREWCQSTKNRKVSGVSPHPGFEFQASSKLSR